MMKSWRQRLEEFWFAAAPPERLAMLRIAVGAFALYYIGARYDMLMKIAGTDASLFDPVGLAVFPGRPLAVGLFQAILIATLLANGAFVLGWRFRITGPLFGLLLMWLLCYRNSWSMIFHSDNAMVMHAMILGLSRAGDAWSLDAMRRRTTASTEMSSEAGWQYGWPIRLICAVTTATYFLSGVAKLAAQGLGWASGEALRAQVAVDSLRKELLGEGAPALAYALYDEIWLFAILGAGTLVFELGAPLALLHKRSGRIWAAQVWLMHVGIFFVMGISFRYQLTGLIFLSFFDAERWVAWAAERPRIARLFASRKTKSPIRSTPAEAA
ncbi:MAG: HTTM domain-containing protein [Blastocatellia bacterium]|nr:HTTM domain-containing protein [Blastocatellia bacterium]